jgi:hypothetical protein
LDAIPNFTKNKTEPAQTARTVLKNSRVHVLGSRRTGICIRYAGYLMPKTKTSESRREGAGSELKYLLKGEERESASDMRDI